jgi:histidinol-phosphatase (PHP family)
MGRVLIWPAINYLHEQYMWANFHTHSHYCDGKTGISELVEEARSCGVMSLGLSSHAPLPFERGWAMKRENLDAYLRDVSSMKGRFGTVEVYAGLEIDYVPGRISPDDFRHKLDFTIGSIHFVDQFPDGEPWEIDNTNAVFMDGLQRIYKGNVRAAISRYFELTREMIVRHTPDVTGHLDKIKIQNPDNILFHEDDGWYRHEVGLTIESLKQAGTIVEINTRGIYQKKSPTTYPSPWIVELLFKSNIPVTLSSDAHHPKDLTSCFAEAATMISKAGYKSIQVLHEGKWQPHSFNEYGILN